MADTILMIADAPVRRCNQRLTTENNDYYMRKIEELANAKLRFFREQELHYEQSEERKKSKASNPPSCSGPLHQLPKTPVETSPSLNPIPVITDRAMAMSNRRRSTSVGEDGGKIKKKRRRVTKKFVRTPVVINDVTERLNEFIVNELKGTELKLVIQKTLYYSDTLQSQNRLSMPIKQLEAVEFLTADERQILKTKENKIEVPLVGPTLEVFKMPMELTMWNMQSSVNYVLKTHWFEFWSENEEYLKEYSKIQVWSFRRGQQLCFAVVCVEKPDGIEGVEVEDDVA